MMTGHVIVRADGPEPGTIEVWYEPPQGLPRLLGTIDRPARRPPGAALLAPASLSPNRVAIAVTWERGRH